MRRLEPGKNVRWEITVQPSGDADVTLSLPVTTDCASQGAICTGDGRMLSAEVEVTVSGPRESTVFPGELSSHRRADHQRHGPGGRFADGGHLGHCRR